MSERPDFRRSADRKVFREIDAKVAVVSDLWRTAMILPVPLASDTPEMIETENRALRGITDRARVRMPEAFEAYSEYLTLGELFEETPRDDTEQQALIRDETEKLKTTKDFEFAETLTLGIPRLIDRRRVLRQLQTEIGEPLPNGVYEKPEVFSGTPGVNFTKDQISRVVMGAYSVSIFVRDEAYEKTYGKKYPKTNGLHLAPPANHVSVIRDYLADYLEKGYIAPSEINGAIYKTLLHEEFHGFADAFTSRSSYFTTLKERLTNQVSLITMAIGEGDFTLTEALIAQVARMLKNVPNSSTEELLAEMVSTDDRDNIPSSTFAVHNGEKGKFLDTMVSHDALASINVRKSAGSLIDNEVFKKRMADMYRIVSWMIPERRADVDFLFVVIPPNKITHIWKTIARWIWEKENL